MLANLMTGMRERKLMTQRIASQRTGKNQNISLTQKPRNQTIGMMKWMVNGNHQ